MARPTKTQARQWLTQLAKKTPSEAYSFECLKDLAPTKAILAAAPEMQVLVVREIIDRLGAIRGRLGHPNRQWHERYPSLLLVSRMLRRKLPFDDDDLAFMIRRTTQVETVSTYYFPFLTSLVTIAQRHVKAHGLSDALDEALGQLSDALERCNMANERKLRVKIAAVRGGSKTVPLEPGEAWSDAALADVRAMKDKQKSAWVELLAHCQTATGSKPTAKWSKQTLPLLKAVGQRQFTGRVRAWFPLVDKPRTEALPAWIPDPNLLIIEPHAAVLKGLAWCCAAVDNKNIARALRDLALSAYKKVPGVGPRAVKIGNACVYALGAMPGMEAVGQLALLKIKVKFGTAQKGIEKALSAAAEREGIPRGDLEEIAVPAYGLKEVGRLDEPMGDFTARLTITGTHTTELVWIKPDGKTQKSVPAAVKRDFADDLRELKTAAKDIQKMLPAQRDRIDGLYLQQNSWPLAIWRQRYLDHPLVGTLARRLIWEFAKGKRTNDGVYVDGQIVGRNGRPIKSLDDDTTVRLWHPIGRKVEEVTAWRTWLEEQQIRQPFKQAHREVYPLTEAEEATRVYSNRYAAHVIKQHQFNALCGIRGWKNTLRLMVDDDYPPATRELPAWALRAEFWVEGAGDEYGVDTNDAGTFLYLATDQVRFYPTGSTQRYAHAGGGGYHLPYNAQDDDQPLPLSDVPPLVFSEVMRDVDLFVGVASVGNDPAWSDGGPEGRYRDYWQGYSFGDLSATGQTRKDVLQRLIPRLKIAPRCSFSDKFLVVRGDVRTYKIHLGSGNILMSPNDQYLCIVPARGTAAKGSDKLFLPFEGDSTLSIILSKALMLADDTKIKDRTILSQIGAAEGSG